jgi:hypothetical protein
MNLMWEGLMYQCVGLLVVDDVCGNEDKKDFRRTKNEYWSTKAVGLECSRKNIRQPPQTKKSKSVNQKNASVR